MNPRGGYNLNLQGRPSSEVHVLPEPEALYLPLSSKRFQFSEACVAEGDRVRAGQMLARDPDSFSLPLLAPRGGVVSLGAAADHVTLTDLAESPDPSEHSGEALADVPKNDRSMEAKRQKLVALGAWQFLQDAHTGALPDPLGTPRAVIVSTFHLEPFQARGDIQIRDELASFTRGLEHLQSLLEYQPMYLAAPDLETQLATQVREAVRGHAWIQRLDVPLQYPFDSFALLARRLGLKRDAKEPVWALDTAGVLAIDQAMTDSQPVTTRILSIGGPAVDPPRHLQAATGYPLHSIVETHVKCERPRIINGGVFTGTTVSAEQRGLDTECRGLTVLPEHTERELLGFTRPGLDRRSYSKCFLSSFRGRFSERLTTALRGEGRACVGCGFCEEVCPAGIMPHVIHKCMYQDALEDAERARVDLCVGCGLCSFVCPSKIELVKEIRDAQDAIQRELHPEEVGT